MFLKKIEQEYKLKLGQELFSFFEKLKKGNDAKKEEERFSGIYESFYMDSIMSDLPEIVDRFSIILDGKHQFYDFISCFLDNDKGLCKLIIRNPETFVNYIVEYDPKSLKIETINTDKSD